MIGKKCFPIGSTEVREALGVGSIIGVCDDTHIEIVWTNEESIKIDNEPLGVFWPVDQVQIHCDECEELFTPNTVKQLVCSRTCQLINPE
jgi:hypothetical protein